MTDTMQIEAIPPHRHLPPFLKLALELGPLMVFFFGRPRALL